MFKILKVRLKQGCKTLLYPKAPAPEMPKRYRGVPLIDGGDQESGVDMGSISFSPDEGQVYSNDFRMAVTHRKDLMVDGNRQIQLACALNDRMLKIFGRSLKLRQVSAGGCNACELDLNVLNTPVFDLSRFGIQFVASPRHADGLVITGPITKNMRHALLAAYEATPRPKLVIALGSCAISGGIFRDSPQALQGLDTIIPVDLFVPGCPPHPLTILDGLLRLLNKV